MTKRMVKITMALLQCSYSCMPVIVM